MEIDGNSGEEPKPVRGRPRLFSLEKLQRAKGLASLGWSDRAIIESLNISPATFYRHKEDWDQRPLKIGLFDFLSTPKATYISQAATNTGSFFYDLNFARMLGQELRVSVRLSFVPFHELLAGVEAGRFDLALGLIGDAEQRRKRVDFSSKYLIDDTHSGSILARAGSGIKVDDKKSWIGKRFSVVRDSMHEQYLLAQFGEKVICRSYATQLSCFNAIRERWVDAIFLTELAFQEADLSAIPGIELLPGGIDFLVKPCIAINKNDGPLKERVERAIQKFLLEGKIEALSKKHCFIKE